MDKSNFLRKERNKLNLKQADLLPHLEVNKGTVTRWESGSAIPSDKLALLSDLGFDIQYVVTGIRSRPPQPSAEVWRIEIERNRLARKKYEMASDMDISVGLYEKIIKGEELLSNEMKIRLFDIAKQEKAAGEKMTVDDSFIINGGRASPATCTVSSEEEMVLYHYRNNTKFENAVKASMALL